MYRAPAGPPPPRSPAASRSEGRFPSPGSGWFFPEPRAPHGGCGGGGRRGTSPRGVPPYSPRSPLFCPSSNRGYRDGSPAGFAGGGGRGFGGHGGGFRRPPSFSSPSSGRGFQSSDSVEKYFSPAMVRDPWAALTPVARQPAEHLRKQQ